MLKNNDYWKKRMELLEESQLKKGQAYVQDLEKQYRVASQNIEKEISTWYSRFAINNNITMAEAKKLLNTKELKEFKWNVKDYIKFGEENALNQQWMKELENASARVHVSRLEALKLQMQQQVEVLYGNQQDGLDKLLRNVYSEGYYHTAWEIQRGFNIGWDLHDLNSNQLDKLLSKPWTLDNKTFSDRLWGNKQQLVGSLQTQLSQAVIRGQSPDKSIKAISEQFNVDKKKAGRLVMTESAAFASASQKDCFNALDVERFEIVATLDNNTSEICQELDGEVFDMKDYEVGVTAPPFHPWCRTTTVPWFADNYTERAARGADGKTYYVPSDMKYPEWKKSFVDGGSKDDLSGIIIDNGVIKPAPKQAPKVKLDPLNFPSYFNTKNGKKHTEAFVDYINNVDGADPDMLTLYNSLGKLENIESNGALAKVSYTAKDHAVLQKYKAYSGEIVEMNVKIPKLDGDDISGSVQTTAHELGHMMDLFGRKEIKNSPWLSESKVDFFKKADTTMSDKVKDLFTDYNKRATGISDEVRSKYKVLQDKLKDEFSDVVKSPYSNINKYKIYTKKQKALFSEMVEGSDYEVRNMMNGVNNLQDIYDALSGGSFRDSGVVRYGHGSKYYRKIDSRVHEVWANYSALSITRPDLIELLAEDKPELVKLMNEIKEELLKKVGD